MANETEGYEITLLDDGTMDTVVSVEDKATGTVREYRYDCESAAGYRDASGALDEEAFFSEVVIPDADSEDWEED